LPKTIPRNTGFDSLLLWPDRPTQAGLFEAVKLIGEPIDPNGLHSKRDGKIPAFAAAATLIFVVLRSDLVGNNRITRLGFFAVCACFGVGGASVGERRRPVARPKWDSVPFFRSQTVEAEWFNFQKIRFCPKTLAPRLQRKDSKARSARNRSQRERNGRLLPPNEISKSGAVRQHLLDCFSATANHLISYLFVCQEWLKDNDYMAISWLSLFALHPNAAEYLKSDRSR
jgi:hypothetical protein